MFTRGSSPIHCAHNQNHPLLIFSLVLVLEHGRPLCRGGVAANETAALCRDARDPCSDFCCATFPSAPRCWLPFRRGPSCRLLPWRAPCRPRPRSLCPLSPWPPAAERRLRRTERVTWNGRGEGGRKEGRKKGRKKGERKGGERGRGNKKEVLKFRKGREIQKYKKDMYIKYINI